MSLMQFTLLNKGESSQQGLHLSAIHLQLWRGNWVQDKIKGILLAEDLKFYFSIGSKELEETPKVPRLDISTVC